MSAFDAARFQALRRGAYGADLRCFAALGSTQDAARQALQDGAQEGCVILAERQDAGRGRWGRRWQGSGGHSLLLTVLLRAEAGRAEPGSLPLLLGVATAEALRALGLPDSGLKWPNDLLWRGRKLGGLLVEAHAGHWLAGLGLNVGQAMEDFEPDLRPAAASLRQGGLTPGRETVLAAVLEAWQTWLERWRGRGAEAWLPAWDARDSLRGRDCRAEGAGGALLGRAEGVESDGSLRLLADDGRMHRVRSGDVTLLRPLNPA